MGRGFRWGDKKGRGRKKCVGQRQLLTKERGHAKHGKLSSGAFCFWGERLPLSRKEPALLTAGWFAGWIDWLRTLLDLVFFCMCVPRQEATRNGLFTRSKPHQRKRWATTPIFVGSQKAFSAFCRAAGTQPPPPARWWANPRGSP